MSGRCLHLFRGGGIPRRLARFKASTSDAVEASKPADTELIDAGPQGRHRPQLGCGRHPP